MAGFLNTGLLNMGGIGGLLGSAPASNMTIAQLFNPASMRNQQVKRGLLNAGLALMNPDPKLPPSLGASIGRAGTGFVQGADQAKQDAINNGMLGVQLNQLQREQDAQAAQTAAINQLIPTLPPDIQSFARAYPQQFGEAYLKAKMPQPSDPYTLSPGQVRYGQNNQPVASLPPDNSGKWDRVTLEDGEYWVKPGTAEKIKIGERPNRNEGEGRDFQQENKLRQSYLDEVKPFAQARQMFQRMRAAYEGTKTDTTGSSDIAMVFSYMKMLDPTSVVREGEQATAQNAGGVPDQIRVMWNKLLSGQRLAPDVRDAFMKQSEMQYQQQEQSYKQTRQTYKNLASQYQLDPERTAPDISYGVQSGGGEDSPPADVDPGLWKYMTPQERALWHR